MFTRLLFVIIVLISATGAYSQSKIVNLLCENRIDPVGIDVTQPRFSWEIQNVKRNTFQTAYELTLKQNGKVQWNSGKVISDQSVHVPYTGQPLQSGMKYEWQVKIWDSTGKVSSLSPIATFVTGYLSKTDWKAKWITPGFTEDTVLRPSPIFRKEFNNHKKVKSAWANISAHGMYEGRINGARIGDAYLTPGWTAYKKRIQYQTYDVTNLLKGGANAITITAGSGWYRGIIGFSNTKNFYGKDIAVICQIDITYEDGTTTSVITDDTWKSALSEIVYSEIYNGETIDARKRNDQWSLDTFDDANWSNARVADYPITTLVATENEPVRKHEVFKPIKLFTTPAGDKVIDFGQNLVGWIVMKANGKAGDTIKISHAEVLDKAGNFYIENLRAAKAQNQYVTSGKGEEKFEPHFTWQGFRYAKIEGYPGEINLNNFEAVALYSDMPTTGKFATSNQLINQLQHNIEWGQRGNFLDVPTDCPQRDERLGWTGDAQAFSRTASFNMNVNSFFSKWLKDLEADQVNGSVPFVIPNVLDVSISSAGWADVVTIAPWNMYLAYGDKQLLSTQYNSMKAYVEHIRSNSKDNLWNTGFHFGDWLFYRPFDDNDGRAAVTNKYLIAQCFYAHSTQLLINAANVLGKTEDAKTYTDLLDKIKNAFYNEYVTPNGQLVSSTQTAYVLALNFDMLPEALRQKTAERLVENIKSYDTHLTTGFLGTPYLCHVLSRYGYDDIAYKLLLQESYPSWLYPVKMGATTIWERWDGIKPDGTFQTPGMNSYNHYAYGAIGDWMYRIMAGIDTYEDGVGYKHIRIKPTIGGNFNHVSASLDTYYGIVGSTWTKNATETVYDIQVPVNTTATIYLPVKDVSKITESGKALSSIKEIKNLGEEGQFLKLGCGSGTYHFTIKN